MLVKHTLCNVWRHKRLTRWYPKGMGVESVDCYTADWGGKPAGGSLALRPEYGLRTESVKNFV